MGQGETLNSQPFATTPTARSRRRSTLIAGAPLAMSALLWLTVFVTQPSRKAALSSLPGTLLYTTGMSGVGPFARLFMLGCRDMPNAMPWTALILWCVYLLLVARTRLGDVHWSLLLFSGLVWCVLGTFIGAYAGLEIT